MEGIVIYESKRKIVYRDGDKAIKTYNETYALSQVLNEALNQAKVSEEGISVPKVYEVKKYNGRYGIVMDYIDGENLETIVSKNSNDAEKYINLFANNYHELVQNKNLNLNNSYGRIKNKIFASELPANIKYGLFYKLREMEFSRDIIHGDYTFSNLVITKDGKPFIFDWGHVAYGDKKFATNQLNWLVGGHGKNPASECVKCGQCEDVCPQNIEIISQLRECVTALEP